MLHIEHPVIKALTEMRYTFYPTGSRYLETHNQQSDHDFYVIVPGYDETNQFKKELLNLGFTEQANGGYCPDDDLRGVFHWEPSADQRKSGLQPIDVLAGDEGTIRHRLKVFEHLKKTRGVEDLTKALKGNAEAWSLFFRLVKDFK